LVKAQGSHEQGMALLVVQQQEGAAAQDDTQSSNQSTREEHVAVDGLAMSIDRASQRMWLCCCFCWNMRGMPELGSPAREGRGEAVGPIGGSYEAHKKTSV
jgi:hypothetical protein